MSSAEERRQRQREATRRYRERHPQIAPASSRRSAAKYRAANPAKGRERKQNYYKKNRNRVLAYQRDYTKRNYERLRQGWRAYAASHREQAKQRSRAWSVANPERVKERARRRRETGYYRQPEQRAKKQEWVIRNREKVRDTLRASGLRRRAQSAGTGITGADWRAILLLWEHRCAYCGTSGSLDAEHRIPVAGGGTSAKENIVPACPTCNRRKHTMTEDEFRLFLVLEREPLDVCYRWREAA